MEKRSHPRNRFLTSFISLSVLACLIICALSGCAGKASEKNPALDDTKSVRLVVTGSYQECRAIESAARRFKEIYPNCSVEYEYLQDFNDMMLKRFESNDDSVDIFLTNNILKGSDFYPYALELYSHSDALDLSDTFDGLVNNFTITTESGGREIYAIPLGAEMRGLYVNKTLLSSFGIGVPSNRSELLAACEKLSEAGYIPFNANPGSFGQQLIFPYFSHIIAEADDAQRALIAECDEGAAELFREPLEFLYTLVEKNYYNYKYVETEYGLFTGDSAEDAIKSFLGIDENGEKKDDVGMVAFMTGSNSMRSQLDKTKEDYHSGIEYEYIIAPISDDGGYAYMSPSRGIAINKNSGNVDWCLEFLNFLFKKDNNVAFAEEHNITPNVRDAVSYVSREYGIPESRISQPEDVTFDYNFYSVVVPSIVAVSKANNPKYMRDDQGTAVMYDFDYYIGGLRDAFTAQRTGGDS